MKTPEMPTTPPYATWSPYRSPEFKAYVRSGHAKNAFAFHKRCILYIWQDGKWVEIDRKGFE